MKKQALLCAAALTTVVVAGAAHAGTLTATTVGTSTVSTPVTVASEVTLDATTSKGTVGLALTPSATAILPSGNALLKVSLTGGATFGSAVTAGAVVAGANCIPTTVVSTGGAAGDSSVTFLVSTLGGCNSTAPIQLLVPVKLADSTSSVDVVTNLTTEAGTPIDGGTASTLVPAVGNTPAGHLISFAKAFDVKIAADTAGSTKVALASKFTTLTGDPKIGSGTLTINPYLLGINASTPVAAGSLSSANFTVKGDLTNLKVFVDGVQATTANKGVVAVANPTAKAYDVTVTTTGATPAVTIPGGAYTLEVQLVPTTASKLTGSNFGPSALETITREGTNYLLPWVASGTLSKTSTSNTVVRIANLGTDATGAVSVELVTRSGAAPATTGLVSVATSIAAKGEVLLTSASLEAAFGADFGRGDIRVTVEGQPENLSIRRFVQSTVTGALSEVSLGRTQWGESPAN